MRRRYLARAKYKPPKQPIKIMDLLNKTLLMPMNMSLKAFEQVVFPKPGTTPLNEAWKVLMGKSTFITGRQLAEKMELTHPGISGFLMEYGLDPLVWLPVGKMVKGMIKGGRRGIAGLSKVLSKSAIGDDIVKGAKALKGSAQNIFSVYGRLPTRKEMGLITREGAMELRPLLENRAFMLKSLQSRIIDRMTGLAKKYKNFSQVDLEMVPTIIEKKFNIPEVIKLHGQAPSKEIIGLARETSKFLTTFHKLSKWKGVTEKDLTSIGYFPHLLTAEARQVIEKLYPKVTKYAGATKLYMPKHRWMLRRSTGFLEVPVEYMKEHHPKSEIIRKWLIPELNVYRIPLTEQKRVADLAKEMRKLGIRPQFRYWTTKEINDLARAGKLPILKGHKVDKFVVDNPYTSVTYRLFGSARAISNQEFLTQISKHESKGGFARTVAEVANDPMWIRSPIIADNVTGGEVLRFPKEVVDVIDKYWKTFTYPEEVSKLLGLYDTALSYWKRWTLLPIPGYHLRNMFGNLWNNYLAGLDNPTRYIEAWRILNGKKGKIGKYSYDQIRKLIVKNSIRGRGFYAREARQEQFMSELVERFAPSGLKKISPLYYGRMVGEAIEDNARIALFIDGLAKGKTPQQAAKMVRKFLFDYDELSLIEKNIFRRVLPFYSWARKNIPLQLEMAITNPRRWLAWAKGARAVEPTLKPDERYMPPWLKEAVPVLWKRDPKTGQYQYFVLHNWIPAADLQDIFKGDTFIEMLSPIIKAPLEWFTNYSSFAERSIERYPSEVQNYLGIQMPRKIANLIRNVRLLNVMDRFNPGYIFGTKDRPGIFGFTREQELELPMKVRLINLFCGLKLYPYHFEQAKRWHDRVQQENVMALRGYQTQAIRRGQITEAVRIQKLIEEELKK
ncbi:MAG: hypothetical protein DRZ76_01970 [Candidatus Nealsonbacteria bacterium]|nr:MAG: hypothetical protein DRZ76_01970 [Candidatus Nealsonbacteria bacterium]